MANHEQDGIGDEDELFSEMLSGDAPKFDAEPDDRGSEPAALEPEKGTRERDELGRFKAKASDTQEPPAEAEPPKQVETPAEAAAQEPATTQQPPAKEEDDGKIPSWRMREIREARDAERNARLAAEQKAAALEAQTQQAFAAIQHLQQQLHALQNPPKKPEPVTLFEDPDAFVGNFVGTVEQRFAAQQEAFQKQLRQMRLENNLSITAMVHKDDFQPAYEAFTQAVEAGDRALAARVFGSADPGGAMVAWHREARTLKEIGTDPNAYLERKLEEKLKDPAFLAKALEAARAQAGGQPVVSPTTAQPASRPNTVTQLPPSLRSVPGAAASSQSTGLESLNDEELFDSIARR